jgi:hypothetical protein
MIISETLFAKQRFLFPVANELRNETLRFSDFGVKSPMTKFP